MEVNKDEAIRCVEIGIQYEEKGEYEKALKFYSKSISLFATDEAKSRYTKLKVKLETGSTHTKKEEPRAQPHHRHQAHSSNNSNNNTSTTSNDWTPEQKELVDKVRKCKDYYEILGVAKDATDAEIKKQYKKLALSCHPDKNRAPGAEEAFKKIGQAFSCLSDAEKRKLYNIRGTEEDSMGHFSRGSSRHAYDGDLTPEEIFSMFFGGVPLHRTGGMGGVGGPGFRTYTYNFGGPATRRTTANRGTQQNDIGSTFFHCIQLLPLILMFLMYAFSFGSNEPLYELQRTSTYSVERLTKPNNIPYYVKPDFDPSSIGRSAFNRLENQIEKEWQMEMRGQCQREKKYQQYLKDQIYWYGMESAEGKMYQKKLQEFDMTACQLLNSYFPR
mmetsp:Transcript_5773/g.8072  ORF Transcript_5773/g.8072 Transcript_5773/m.8072 type:complete len:386 (-) Transcript_5773:19-1176(-)